MQKAVRIVVLDYYMSAPKPGLDVTYSEFRGTSISQVPILRCFGSDENGKKICVHIHGVFPYLYIPYDDKGKPDELTYQLATAIDKAVNVSFNQGSSNSQHVYKISLVSGIPMYGYHSKKHQFFKIYLYNPSLVLKVGNLLLKKNILNQVFQPHEIHLNFTLQFMIDYNLHGMSNMLISEMKYRVNSDKENTEIDKHLFLPGDIQKTSLCELEGDINAESIINREEILSGTLAVNPGIASIWEDEKQRRRNKNADSQLGNFLELTNMNSAPTKTHLIFQQALKERLAAQSTDQDIPKQSPDASVYPAETPFDSNIQNASALNVTSNSSLELSLDDTLVASFSQEHNETITPDGDNVNMAIDEDAQDFLRLLQELAEEKVPANEDGSILSQTDAEDQNDHFVEDLDLSMPLASLTTPIKIDSKPINNSSDEDDTDYFNSTLIPQLDGQIDSEDQSSSSGHNPITTNARDCSGIDGTERDQQITLINERCGRSMPLLDNHLNTGLSQKDPNLLDKFNLVPYVQLTRLKIELPKKVLKKRIHYRRRSIPPRHNLADNLARTLHLFRYRLNKIISKSKLQRLEQILSFKDKYAMNLCGKVLTPKFNIRPGSKWFLKSLNKDVTNSVVISHLIQLTHYYTDPDLHILVKTPNSSYLFYYGGYTFPCSIEVQDNLTTVQRELLCSTYGIVGKKPTGAIIKRKKIAFLQDQLLKPLNAGFKSNLTIKTFFKPGCRKKMSHSTSENQEIICDKLATFPKIEHESDLQSDCRKANLMLEDHLRFLRDFNSNMLLKKSVSKNIFEIACLEPNFQVCDDGKYNGNDKTVYLSRNFEDILCSHGDSFFSNKSIIESGPAYQTTHIKKDTINTFNVEPMMHHHKSQKFSGGSTIKTTSHYSKRSNNCKRSISVSDSDYSSFSGDSSTRKTSYGSENDFFLNLSPIGMFSDNSLLLDGNITGTPFNLKRRIDLIDKYKSNSSYKPLKPLINVISNIQLRGPLKIDFARRSTLEIGTDNSDICYDAEGASTTESMAKNYCPNMYINCDGTADSSSEDERKTGATRKCIKRKSYAPLGISIAQSCGNQGNYSGGLTHNPAKFSDGNHKPFQESSTQVDQPDLSKTKKNVPYKRKLIFENENTVSEEFISCIYRNNASTNQIADYQQNHDARAEVLEPFNFQNPDASSSDSDLFSDNDNNLNKSFFRSYNFTVSEKYDYENNYKAKEGCSTIFSPSLSNSSMKSQENKVLSDNTSSDIPPYQATSQNNIIPSRAKKIACIRKPSFKAPTKLDLELSLPQYKIPRNQQEEPYYSNVDDYTGVVEIGHRVLRIASKTTAHLSEFESEFSGINNHRKYIVEDVAHLTWNSNNIKSLKLTHCSNRTVIIYPIRKPPSVKQVEEWIKENAKPSKIIYSEVKEERSKIHIPNSPGNDSDLDLSLSLTPYTSSSSLNDFSSHSSTSPVLEHQKKKCKIKPPSLRDSLLQPEKSNNSYQITGISQPNSFGFDQSVQNLQAARAFAQHQYLTTMVMELHVRTRGELKPDPQFDSICAIFYSILNDVPDSEMKKTRSSGVIAVNCLPSDLGTSRPDFLNGINTDCDISYVETENALINEFISVIKYWDPDIFAGYEIEMLSWGYLVDRSYVLSINILPLLGRSQLHKFGKVRLKSPTPELETNIIGRIVLNVWRIMRHEIALQSYTFESIVYHILHRRVPMYPFKDLTFWWDHRSNLFRHRVVRYYLQRVNTILELFAKLDFLNRTSELARLFGILFYEVLSRGSQFRVESMMLRLAKPLNYVPVSPDVTQRAQMKAPEFIPLVMEPESKFYTDPVIVLDFQSLYPSIIIAYNYCFTTCVGRVNNLGTNYPYEFGATQLKISRKLIGKLCKKDLLNYSPCGVAFVKQKVREGILPRMLKEVLDTRLMVKNSMKENKGDNNLQKVLHNRQLGLKLIANVTYGYTAANFSGRMCCVEVGDSVVSKGRETLQRAIAMVETTSEWEARVVYGDTDSLFVLVSGKTKEEAFEIGKKIADAITADNPDPIKLKLEKVYQPCILQTKKRYVGYMYESPDQQEPVYEAKGIETVRRDGCPAVAKMLQKCLTLLFETKNVSLIKNYVLKQFNKIQTGRASIQDLTFAKEYRGAKGYKPGACVPALELAHKWTAVDKRNEPRRGERVPYIIINGPPGLPLIRLVRSPRELLSDNSLRPNALYYITKVIIPPINRCFNLIGADLNIWFNQMPRKNTQYLPNSSPIIKNTISQYFVSKVCASCFKPTQDGICAKCCQRVNVTTLALMEKLKKWEENYYSTLLICQSCTGCLDDITCASLDCPVLYRRTQAFNDLQQSAYVRELLTTNAIFSEENFFETDDF